MYGYFKDFLEDTLDADVIEDVEAGLKKYQDTGEPVTLEYNMHDLIIHSLDEIEISLSYARQSQKMPMNDFLKLSKEYLEENPSNY